MLNSPDRGMVKKKWAVCKADGPTIMFAELVQKKLHHHKIPCDYTASPDGAAVTFHPARWRREFRGDFTTFLSIAVSHVNAERRVTGQIVQGDGQRFTVILDGPHEITDAGVLRQKKEKLSDRAKSRKP